MVLSLFELSLRAIMNGIENGTIRHLHLLPPNLRERILDTAIKRGLANHPNEFSIFTSIDFLTGMTSISANACTEEDIVFLQSVTASLAANLPNGEMVGAAITKLNLKGHISRIFSTVPDLIVQCPNTTTLALRVTDWWDMTHCPLNEYENSACNRIMENMVKLSLRDWGRILNIQLPIINFKQLTTLNLDNCYIHEETWRMLLVNIRPTLENLHLINVHCYFLNGLGSILPFSMPQLKSLEVSWWRNQLFRNNDKCNKAFVDNLLGCPELRQVHLMLDQYSTDEESLVRLASMDVDLKIKIWLSLRGNDPAENATVFDSSSRFKFVSIFHERIDSFFLRICCEWDPQFSTALEDMVNTCSALTMFCISLPTISYSSPIRSGIKPEEEMNRVNSALGKFFGASERVLRLKDLYLVGNFGETVMSAVFENCLNLVRLAIFECPNLRDQHLIDWVSRGGGKLTYLRIFSCDNVTSEGIIPILARSAENLLSHDVSLKDMDGGRNWKTLARNICPNAKFD